MNKFKPLSPDPYLKKDADMSLAKFGHLNAIVDEINTINTDITPAALRETVLGFNTEYLYVEQNISSAQILSLASVGVTSSVLVPNGKYAVPVSVIFEFSEGNISYDIGNFTSFRMVFQNGVALTGNIGILESGEGNIVELVKVAYDPLGGLSRYSNSSDGTAPLFTLSCDGGGLGENPTLGNGTAKLKVQYQLRTFGSEL